MTTNPDKKAIADYIHASKYAQYIPALKRRETFNETVSRVKRMHKDKFPELCMEIDKAFWFVHDKKVLPSMRSMQFAGEPIKERNERMYNCSFTLIDRPEVFGHILYLLLCGCGVGFSVQKQHVSKLPTISFIDKTLVCHHVVEDTIEGWANAVTSLINSFINGYHIEFCYHRIRPVGSQLKSGGKAPGYKDLKEALEACRSILDKVGGRQLKPLECHDMICHLSKAVLAGGIRRSSLISLFSYDDKEMMNCKTPLGDFHFWPKETNSQRALCNNSVVLHPKHCTKDEFMWIMEINKANHGDPGFIFIDDFDCGINPCGEIGINPVWKDVYSSDSIKVNGQTGFGFCNLVEINAAKCNSEVDFYAACNAASFIATLQASYTDFPYIGKVSEDITKRDALIGVSITGMMDAIPAVRIFEKSVLQCGALLVKVQNERTAKEIGINPAVRCTCIKPSGTSSLELGCVSSGIHPHPFKYYLRRITANPLESVAKFFKKHNPQMVETKPNGNWCITFPVKTEGRIQDEFDAEKFVDIVFKVYHNWILPTHSKDPSHNVSCTVIVDHHEWKDVFNHIWENKESIRSMTFLPKDAYKSIPYMPIEAHKPISLWAELTSKYQPVDYSKMIEEEDTTLRGAACDGDSCGIEGQSIIVGEGLRVFEGDQKTINFINHRLDENLNFNIDGLWFEFIQQFNGYFIAKRISGDRK